MISRPNLNRRRMLALTGAALAAVSPASAAILRDTPATRTATGRAFATDWRITLPDLADPETMRAPVQQLLDGIDRAMSPWRAGSEITLFNRAPATVMLSPETALVAECALALAQDSGGWFDPTVGPLVAQWGFGPIEGDARPDWRGLDLAGRWLAKSRAGLTFDPCGIAKGRALDLMAARLTDAGHRDFLIDLGGELAARGQHPAGRPWQVAIEDPRPGIDAAAAIIALPDGMGIATSGRRAQSYDLAGQTYGHIIDPRHAAPVQGAVASVTVLAAQAMDADGWATALAAAGPQGPDLARRRNIAALFLLCLGEELRQITTGGFDRHLL